MTGSVTQHIGRVKFNQVNKRMNKKKNLASFEVKQEALALAQSLLKNVGTNLDYRDMTSLHALIGRLSNSETRNKVTYFECEKVIHIAKNYSKISK